MKLLKIILTLVLAVAAPAFAQIHTRATGIYHCPKTASDPTSCRFVRMEYVLASPSEIMDAFPITRRPPLILNLWGRESADGTHYEVRAICPKPLWIVDTAPFDIMPDPRDFKARVAELRCRKATWAEREEWDRAMEHRWIVTAYSDFMLVYQHGDGSGK